MRFLQTTVIGGIVFLIPIIVTIAVIGKALEVTDKIAAPLASGLPINSIGGVAIVHLLAIAILVLICFLAGLAAKTRLASRLVGSLEMNLLSKLPAYALLKTKTQSMLSPDDVEGVTPVVARFDDSWQVALEIERLEDGKVVVFLPGAPDYWSGSICVMTADRITPLDLPVLLTTKMAKRLGRGSKDVFRDKLLAAASPD